MSTNNGQFLEPKKDQLIQAPELIVPAITRRDFEWNMDRKRPATGDR
jgi:hypothetical protein